MREHDESKERKRRARFAAATLLLVLGLAGCSIKKMAVNKIGDSLASGDTTFASDEDPELVREAVPFSLKLMESLLEQSPKHQGLLTAAASGFTQYSYAFVQQDADEMEDHDFAKAQEMRARSKKLFLRARDYGLRGLDVKHAGFTAMLREDPNRALRKMTAKDVPLLYWTAAAWGAAISLSKDTPDLVADQLQVEALIDRALVLDEKYSDGAIHGFLINYEGARQGAEGDAAARSLRHFERVVELTGGKLAAPFVARAENISVQKQNRAEFEALLKRALAINPNEKPEWRLQNLIVQRRARWLLVRTDELFAE